MSTDDQHADEQDVAESYDDLDPEEQHALVALATKLGVDDPVQAAKDVATDRRTFLGGLTGAAAAGSVAYSAGRAQAGTQSAGQVGTQANPVDVYGEDLYDPSGNTRSVADIVSGGAFSDGDGDNIYTLPNASDGIDVGSVDTDELYTEARGPKTVIRNDGGTYRADGPTGEIASGTDLGAVLQSVHDNLTTPGWVHIQAGDYDQSTQPTFSKDGIVLTGAGPGSTSITATAAINSFVKVARTGANIARAPTVRELQFLGNGNATHALHIETSEEGLVEKVRVENTTGAAFYATSTEGSVYTDNWSFKRIRVEDAEGFKFEPGASQIVSDCELQAVSVLRPGSGNWGAEMLETQRVEIKDFFTGSSSDFAGGIRFTNPNTAGKDAAGNKVEQFGIEDRSTGDDAIGVKFDGQDNASFLRRNDVSHIRANSGGDIVELVDAGAGNVRSIRVRQVLGPATMTIGSGVANAKVWWHDETADPLSDISDNGTRTLINGLGYNSGSPATGGDWNGNGIEGVAVRDTTNSNTYLYNNGTWSQIASS